MVTVLVIAGSGVLPTLIVPATSKSIVLAPGSALEAMIACRNEPAPALCRFVTANVAIRSRLSRTSTPCRLTLREDRRSGACTPPASPVPKRFTRSNAFMGRPLLRSLLDQ